MVSLPVSDIPLKTPRITTKRSLEGKDHRFDSSASRKKRRKFVWQKRYHYFSIIPTIFPFAKNN
jgi:hypothetical protein